MLAWGNFLTLTINFLIVAFVLFMVIRAMNHAEAQGERRARRRRRSRRREEELLTEIRDLLKKA